MLVAPAGVWISQWWRQDALAISLEFGGTPGLSLVRPLVASIFPHLSISERFPC